MREITQLKKKKKLRQLSFAISPGENVVLPLVIQRRTAVPKCDVDRVIQCCAKLKMQLFFVVFFPPRQPSLHQAHRQRVPCGPLISRLCLAVP